MTPAVRTWAARAMVVATAIASIATSEGAVEATLPERWRLTASAPSLTGLYATTSTDAAAVHVVASPDVKGSTIRLSLLTDPVASSDAGADAGDAGAAFAPGGDGLSDEAGPGGEAHVSFDACGSSGCTRQFAVRLELLSGGPATVNLSLTVATSGTKGSSDGRVFIERLH